MRGADEGGGDDGRGVTVRGWDALVAGRERARGV